jgi:hypothetical protein
MALWCKWQQLSHLPRLQKQSRPPYLRLRDVSLGLFASTLFLCKTETANITATVPKGEQHGEQLAVAPHAAQLYRPGSA